MDIPICAAENVEGFEAKGILISPMYIYNKNAAALWGVGGGCYPKYRQAQEQRLFIPITFNYRKYIIGCITDNSVALISQCCIADTNTHNVIDRNVLINRIFY